MNKVICNQCITPFICDVFSKKRLFLIKNHQSNKYNPLIYLYFIHAPTPFQFTIYGAGDLEQEMHEFITKHQLGEQVVMAGVVDFYKTLIPKLQQLIDVFVCLHRQSDPSCTYLETLSCGVPIVGYKNRAFSGLLECVDIGLGGELNNLDEICRIIAHLHENRGEIIEKSKNSAAFAQQHDFDTTFQNRIDHLTATVDSANNG